MKKHPIPSPLQELPDPPKKLFVRGKLPSFEEYVYLCIIGSRKHTGYGQEVCEMLVAGLKGYPIVIVSGLALGLDSIALLAGLRNGLKVVALPGSGLSDKVLYPASNLELAHKILKSKGALLSEFEPDYEAATWSFPKRNRLMAGLCKAVLVIEAENKSGSRITAKLATQYNRDVLAVPGSIFSRTSDGTNQLLREGAIPVTNPNELLEALGFEVTDTKPIDLMKHCSPDEKKVLSLLASPMPRGDLIRALGTSTSDANILLGAMEIKGFIKESMGEMRRC